MAEKCEHPAGVEIRPDGVHALDPCVYEDIEEHRNVTVIVSRCKYCGAITLGWKRTAETESIYFTEEGEEYE